ncbi:hypothetical protein, partial [Mesorhizobium japonicum]|uniref:hypothetical protein n=1 Tax=Mesorhizobium japonicum TaxID=2066070 RepID=UPI003B5B363E
VAGFSVNEATNDASDGGTTTIGAVISKEFNKYLFNLSAGTIRYGSALTGVGYLSATYGYYGGLGISHQVFANTWLGLDYGIGSAVNTYTQNYAYYGLIPSNNRTLYNTVGLSLKVLF